MTSPLSRLLEITSGKAFLSGAVSGRLETTHRQLQGILEMLYTGPAWETLREGSDKGHWPLQEVEHRLNI